MRPVGPERGAPPPGRGPRVSPPPPGRRAGGGGTRLPPGGGGIVRPPAGTTRGPPGVALGGGVPVGRGIGGREVMLAPGRDDTTRGALPAGGAVGVGVTGAAGAAGVAGATDAAGATGCGATGAASTGAASTGAAGVGAGVVATGATSSSDFFARAVLARAGAFFSFGSAVSSAVFFVFFGFSAAGSRFRPFSSA